MGKYEPLYKYLIKSEEPNLCLVFAEIEKILGDKLPASAYVHRQWWANNKSKGRQANAWIDAGYKIENINFNKQTVLFELK